MYINTCTALHLYVIHNLDAVLGLVEDANICQLHSEALLGVEVPFGLLADAVVKEHVVGVSVGVSYRGSDYTLLRSSLGKEIMMVMVMTMMMMIMMTTTTTTMIEMMMMMRVMMMMMVMMTTTTTTTMMMKR